MEVARRFALARLRQQKISRAPADLPPANIALNVDDRALKVVEIVNDNLAMGREKPGDAH